MEEKNANINHPCYGCKPPKRHQGCHTTCPEGIAADERHREEKAKIDAMKTKEEPYRGYKNESRARMDRWKYRTKRR